MKKCDGCGTSIVWGGIPWEGKLYCGDDCGAKNSGVVFGFCEQCLAATTDEGPGNMVMSSYFGSTLLINRNSRCPQCKSYLCRVWGTMLMIPYFPRKKFRIIFLTLRAKPPRSLAVSKYLGRRLNSTP